MDMEKSILGSASTSLAKLPDLLKEHRLQQQQLAALQERVALLEQRHQQD